MILFRAAFLPWEAFPLREESWPRALGRMLLWRTPVAFLESVFVWRMVGLAGPLAQRILAALPDEEAREAWRALLGSLPAPPPLGEVWPWLLLAAPLMVAGAWLHHAAWDHGCLWLMGAFRKTGKGARATLMAEAQALEAGVVGALIGLLGYLPQAGGLLWPLTSAAGLWFWGLRGVAMARVHGLPVWKGVAATALHALLAACCLGCLGILMMLQLAWAVAG